MSDELPAEVLAWIGRVVVVDEAEVLVERGLIENFCSSVEDGNPLYWDETVANEVCGGIISPPAMLSAYNRPHPWTPKRGDKPLNRPLELHFKVKDALDYPRGIVTELCFEFGVPVRPGDRLRAEQSLREVSEIKTNKLGTGRNWTIDVTYKNQSGAVAGVETLSFFGYRRAS
ncbi:MAG: MaoC family dehydratase N-terminal domain-containing protein [Pseudomonadales bacterium]|nr:MaoC family dehydratase N-terminal domain-containing protein [Pseudomonadales bacterium]